MKIRKLDILMLILLIIIFRYTQLGTTYLLNNTMSIIDRQIFMLGNFIVIFLSIPVVILTILLIVFFSYLPQRKISEKQKMKELLKMYKEEFGTLSNDKYEEYRSRCI